MYLKRYNKKGLEASIFLVTLPLMFNIVSIFIVLYYYLGLSLLAPLGPIAIGIFMIITGFRINHLLERWYLEKDNFRVISLPSIFYLFAPIYYLSSFLIFPFTFRFL